ncbi:MAG: hypothetical protein WC584_04710 [Candidatus Pacearchaeota archaeon]
MRQEVIIVDEKDLERKVKSFKNDGVDKLHVLADFDKTLTNLFLPNGKKVNSLISIIRNGPYLGKEYSDKANALFDIYHSIEVDPAISLQVKKKKMYEWWDKHFSLLGESGLSKKVIEKCTGDILDKDLIVLRKGVDNFFYTMENNQIPIVIISSSIGDLIKEFLIKKKLILDNVHVLANELSYDKKGNFIGVKDIVHVFNKDETSVKDHPEIFKKIEKRKNVLLLGDSLGDVGMIEGFNYDNLIKIGFYNDDEEGDLKDYKKNFDVILTGDQDFNYVNKLVKKLGVYRK